MKIIECKQRTPEWLEARIGIPTASQFHRVMTPKTKKRSSQADDYLNFLLAEWLVGRSLEDFSNDWTERGMVLEDDAVSYFEALHEVNTQEVGFITTNDGLVGCSPDRIGTFGGLEIKCPGIINHVGYMRDPSLLKSQYWSQVQGSMWVTGLDVWHLMSYHGELPPVELTVERDDKWHKAFTEVMAGFLKELKDAKCKLEKYKEA